MPNEDFTVAQLIKVLQEMPQDYWVGTQSGDELNSPVFRIKEVKADHLWEIVDLVMEEI